MPSRAEAFFTQIKDSPDPAAAIRKLVTDHISEQEYLEFKSGEKLDDKPLKRYWSESLSAFANTEGGVIIFGIATGSTTPTEDGRANDVAVGFDLLKKPDQLAQQLRDLLLNSTVEPVNGVECLSIKESNGQGFVMCLIPEGKHKPYRALSSDPKQVYFQRVDDSSVVISHSLLRSMFYPSFTTKVELKVVRSNLRDHTKGIDQVNILGSLLNSGRRTASNICVRVESNKRPNSVKALRPFTEANTVVTSLFAGIAFQAVAPRPINPGESTPAFDFETNTDNVAGLNIKVSIYLDNQDPILYLVSFDALKIITVKEIEASS